MTDNTEGQFDDCSSGNVTTNAGYDDSSELHPTCGFDYESVFIKCGDAPDNDEKEFRALVQAEARKMAMQICIGFAEWIYQNGSNDQRGLALRAGVFCHRVIPHLRVMSMTEFASGYGWKKQSMGRWVEDPERGFDARFPTFALWAGRKPVALIEMV